MIKNKNQLINSYCKVEFNDYTEQGSRKMINCEDLTDHYNLPALFTKNIRGIEKAWDEINDKFNDNTKFGDIYDILDEFNLKVHSYCRMD